MWELETVDGGGWITGYQPSLASDSPGRTALSYQEISDHGPTTYDLNYAHFDGSTWIIDTVDGYGNAGSFSSSPSTPPACPRSAITTTPLAC